jgi:hypothetical protein
MSQNHLDLREALPRLGEHPDHIASFYRRLPQACQSFEKASEKTSFLFCDLS